MGLFSKSDDQAIETLRAFKAPTLEEASEQAKQQAIDYIISLDKAEKDKFFEGAELVWQGYNNSLDKVATRHQKTLRRNARQAGVDSDDDLIQSILDDEGK